MPIRWDPRNKRWRYEFDRLIEGRRHRTSRLLPKGWTQAQADAFDRKESGRLYAVATGIERRDSLIDEAVVLYLQDKQHLKSLKAAEQHLNEIAWAYTGKPLSALPEVAREIATCRDGAREGTTLSVATIRNRLALLKAACRWAWKRHSVCESDPTSRMQLPPVRNERHVYIGRAKMLRACRACTNWEAQVAIRVAFYTGMRLGELYQVAVEGDLLVLHDTKNGDRRAVPVHPRIRHLLRFLPLTAPKITIQRAWERARDAAGLQGVRFHDLRHSAASEMVNAGVDLYTVGKVLGHRDSRSTERYSHLTAGTLADAVLKIGRRA
jgi:integrase